MRKIYICWGREQKRMQVLGWTIFVEILWNKMHEQNVYIYIIILDISLLWVSLYYRVDHIWKLSVYVISGVLVCYFKYTANSCRFTLFGFEGLIGRLTVVVSSLVSFDHSDDVTSFWGSDLLCGVRQQKLVMVPGKGDWVRALLDTAGEDQIRALGHRHLLGLQHGLRDWNWPTDRKIRGTVARFVLKRHSANYKINCKASTKSLNVNALQHTCACSL